MQTGRQQANGQAGSYLESTPAHSQRKDKEIPSLRTIRSPAIEPEFTDNCLSTCQTVAAGQSKAKEPMATTEEPAAPPAETPAPEAVAEEPPPPAEPAPAEAPPAEAPPAETPA
ncbi:unnamed protein product [Calypogeia fissa]